MKWYKKYFSLRHYVSVLRRQPVHMQHVYAFIFSASVTALAGAIILYYDYGFWRDTYVRTEPIQQEEIKKAPAKVESPGDMLHGFLEEASVKLKNLNENATSLLDGTESYKKETIKETITATGTE